MIRKIPEVDQAAGSIFSKRAFLEPDKEAVVYKERRLTYGQLEQRTNRLASACLELGVEPGSRVAILMPNCNEYLEIVLGMGKIGAVVVLLNFRLVAREIAFILNDAGATVLFYSDRFSDLVEVVGLSAPQVKHLIEVNSDGASGGYEALLKRGSSRVPDIPVGLDRDFMIIYTAGTTGRPKGAVITHRNSLYSSLNTLISTRVSNWRPLVAGPLFHVASINANSIPCILVGGTQIILDMFDPDIALQCIEREKCTLSTGVPLFAKLMLEIQREKQYDISSLETFIIGGAPIPSQLSKGWLQFGVRLVELYGMTETTSGTCFCDDVRIIHEKEGSAGKPVLFTNLRIVDEHGCDLSDQGVGEIIVSGPSVIKGYWNRDEENKKTFKDGWFYTGDLGRFDEDGFLYIVGRKKDMIKSGGENIYPAELELTIMEHEAIDAVSVVGVPDRQWGEIVCAAVVLKKGALMPEDEFTEFCRGNMARYKVPKKVRFVEQLPRNVMGKILKDEVRKLFADNK